MGFDFAGSHLAENWGVLLLFSLEGFMSNDRRWRWYGLVTGALLSFGDYLLFRGVGIEIRLAGEDVALAVFGCFFMATYAGLGYAPQKFDNAVIRALDRILATPEVEDPPAVVPVGGIYKFADPDLEQLAPVQKLLLRMGPDNAEVVRAKAAELRAALLRE